jgi:hypothetical protein
VNIVSIEIAQPPVNPKGLVNPRPVSLTLPTSRDLAGFLSLFAGLLNQPKPTSREIVSEPTTKPASSALGSHAPASKEKETKTANPPDAKLGSALVSPIVPKTAPETDVRIQMAKMPGGVVVQDPLISLLPPISLPPISLLDERESPIAFGTAKLGAVPGFPAIGVAPEHAKTIGIAPNLTRDVAFALRLTWQGPPSAFHPGAARSDSTSDHVPEPTVKAVALSEGTVKIDSSQAGNPDVRIQDSEHSVRDPLPSVAQLAGSSFSSPQPTSESRLLSGSAGSQPQNQKATTGRNALTEASSEIPPRLEADVSSDGSDTEPLQSGMVVAPDQEKSAAESRQSPIRLGLISPVNKPKTDASPSRGPDQVPTGLTESDTVQRLPGAPSSSSSARQGSFLNHSRSSTGQDSETSDSDAKTPKVPTPAKLLQMPGSHETTSVASNGILLGERAGAGGPPHGPTKTLEPETHQSDQPSPEMEAPNSPQSQPIHEMSLRLPGAESHVDVQVSDRAGRIQVEVRTADPDLAKSLQTNLGDLVGHLEEKGFRTEPWTPGATLHAAAASEPSNSANSHPDNSGSRGGNQDPRHGQQESNQRQQQRWKSQFEETLSTPNTASYEGEEA